MAERRQLLISCEHGGNRVPPDYDSLFLGQDELLESHRGYDPGALHLARMLARELKVPLAKAETTRLLIDLNRSLQSDTLFSEIVAGLDKGEKQHIIEQHYLPYRAFVTEKVRDFIACGAQVVHLSVHTFTPSLHGILRNAHLGLLYDPACPEEKKFCRNWQDLLKQQLPGRKIRCNYPYRGTADGLVRTLRACFKPQDYLGLELEVNQALLEGRKGFSQSLQDGLLRTLQELFSTD